MLPSNVSSFLHVRHIGTHVVCGGKQPHRRPKRVPSAVSEHTSVHCLQYKWNSRMIVVKGGACFGPSVTGRGTSQPYQAAINLGSSLICSA